MLGLVTAGCLQRRSSVSSRSSVFVSTSRTRSNELAIQAALNDDGSDRLRSAGPSRRRSCYSLRAVSGPVIRLSSGIVDAMTPSEATSPASTIA